MAKQLNVSLAFTADTSQAAAQVRNLQQQLTTLINQPVGLGQKLTADIREATTAAAELKVHLQNATNVKTGTLDFGKLNQSLKASGTSLSQYAAKLQSLGPQGQQAFMTLARSVAQAEVPLRRSNALLSQLGIALANTARWQLSSSILHGFMGSIQKAYGYAKDLNESLNNIRIVTGYNIDQMSKFAVEANKAAKALSTTTTEYTNASLIYYQQGLSDAEVKARTDVTIKLANVSRQSAEIVSDQMTSIWNNFYDGSRSLEYYADVVTALGAATASSSEEIAQGLEKFAAVAETVGLSYEYATAALATVTATTRQSADVVGTAFKTLFARIQDLNLGKTLDDGTTLGQYSQALAAVGISIKDTSGEMKQMDQILEEMAQKWDILGKSQQVALAQSVAGVRQYTQLIALMDNWDFMQENLLTANTASGTLNEQADIYAESWEAASNRARASMENIYKEIMNDEFFISLTDGFTTLTDGVGSFIKSIGGLKGVLFGLGTILTKVFHQQLAQGFSNLAYNIQMSTKAGARAIQQAKIAELQQFSNTMVNYDTQGPSSSAAVMKQIYSEELIMQQQLLANSSQLSAEEQQKYQFLIDQHRIMGEQTIELSKQLELKKQSSNQLQDNLMGRSISNWGSANEKENQLLITEQYGNNIKKAMNMGSIDVQLQNISQASKVTNNDIETLKKSLAGILGESTIDEVATQLQQASGDGAKMETVISNIRLEMSKTAIQSENMLLALSGVEKGTAEYEQFKQQIQQLLATKREEGAMEERVRAARDQGTESLERYGNSVAQVGKKVQSTSQLFASVTSGIMSLGMLVSSFNGLMDTLKDPDASGWEKFGQILTSVSMIAMSLTGVFSGVKAGYDLITSGALKNTTVTTLNTMANYLNEKSQQKKNRADLLAQGYTMAEVKALEKENKEKAKGIVLDKMSTGSQGAGDNTPSPKTPVKLNAGTMKTLGGALAKFAAVAAAVAVVTLTLKAASDQMHSYETAAKDAATQAEYLGQAAEKTKEAYNNFTSNLNAYKDAKDSLKDMTEGTVEYQEAVLKANEAAMELIKNNKSLAGAYKVGENGLIEIDPEALKKAQQQELDKMAQAQSSAMLAQSVATRKQAEADRAKFAKDMYTFGDNKWTAINSGAGAGAGALAGALVGSVVPIIGTGLGAALGGIIGGLGGLFGTMSHGSATSPEMEAIEKLTAYYEKNGSGNFVDRTSLEEVLRKDLNINDKDLINALTKDTEATLELVAVQAQAKQDEKNAWYAAYAAKNQSNTQYQDFENQEYLNIVGEQQASSDTQIAADVKKLWSGSNDDFWAAYLREVLGDTNVDEGSTTGDKYRVTDLYGKGVTLQQKNEEGVWETIGDEDGLSESAAEAALIEARKMNASQEAMGDVIKKYNEMAGVLQDAGVGKELEKYIMNTTAQDKKLDFSKFTPQEIAKINTDALSSNPEMQAAVKQGLEEYKKSLPAWYEEAKNVMTDQEIELAWSLNIDKNATLKNVQDAVAAAQSYLDSKHLNITLNVLDQIESAIKNGEFDKAKELYLEEFGGNEEGWLNLLSLGSTDAIMEHLAAMRGNINTAGEGIVEESIVATEAAYEAGKERKAAADSAVTEAEEAVAAAEKAAENAATDAIIATDAANQFAITSQTASNKWGSASSWALDAGGQGQVNPDEFLNLDVAHEHFSQIANDETLSNDVRQQAYQYAELYRVSGLVASSVDPIRELQSMTATDENDQVIMRQEQIGVDKDGNPIYSEEQLNMYEYWQQLQGGILQDLKNNGIVDPNATTVPYGFDFWRLTKDQSNNGAGTRNSSYGATALNLGSTAMLKRLSQLDAGLNQVQQVQADAQQAKIDADNRLDTEENNLKAAQEEQTQANAALTEGDDSLTNQYGESLEARLNLERSQDKSIQDAGFNVEEIREYAEGLQLVSEKEIETETEAINLAIANSKVERGLNSLVGEYDNLIESFKNKDKDPKNYAKALTTVVKGYEDILNLSDAGELLSEDFLASEENLELVKKAAEGDVQALQDLRAAAAQDIIINAGLEDTDLNNLNNSLDQFFANEYPNLEIGVDLSTTDFYKTLDALVREGKMTADEMSGILTSIGGTPPIQYIEIPANEASSFLTTTESQVMVPDGNGGWKAETVTSDTVSKNLGETTIRIPIVGKLTDKQQNTLKGTSGKVVVGSSSFTGKTAGNGSKKSKGGGGSNKKELKALSDEKDRYHVIREEIEDLTKSQEKLSKAKDQAFGKAKLDLMQAEVKVLDDLIAKQDEYLAEIDDYLRKDRAKMIVYGAEFDENGVISNYDALLQKELDIYNAAVEKFNKDGNEEAFEAAEKRYENFKKDLEQYEETMDLWEDEQVKRAEMMREKWDQQFEALTYEIEFKLDIEEDSLKMLDYFLSKIEDDAFAAAEAIGLLGQQTQDAIDKIELNRQGIEGLLGMHNLDMSILDQIQKGEVSLENLGEYGFNDEEISQLRTYVEGLTDGNTELLELRETIQDKVLEALDAWNEKIDTNIDKMDSLTSIMESYQSIIELMGKSTLKLNDDFLNNLAQEGVNNSVNKLATSVAKYNGLLEEQARAQEALDEARKSGSEQDIKLWEKTLQEVGTMVDEAQQGMMDSWNEALESAADAFEQAVTNAVDTFEKSMAGAFGNLDGLQEVFDQQAEIAERYLADYAKIYELNKLNRDITNSIDDNDSIKAKRVLRDLQKEINDLQESETELSQYDVDHLRKKYELRLAEIALEEAQNAKSQVRMRRDTEGNWSYVYTADANKVEEARQNYEDKLYEMQELNNEYIHEMQSNILKSEVELANALRELDKVKFASDEEYYAEVARLQGYYLGQHNYYTDELNKALGNNQETYDVDWTNYSNLTGYKISKNEEYTDKFNETILSQLTGYQTLEEVQDAFTNHSQAMVEDLKVAYDNWKANYDTIFNTAGTSIDNFANTTASAYEKIATESQKATEDAQQTAKDMTTAFDDICTAVTSWQETWSAALSEAIKENEKFIASTYNLIKALSELKGTLPETDKPSESTQEDINNAKNELNNSNKALSPEDKWGKKGWNNQGYRTEDVIKAQELVHVSADGRWGPISEQAAIEAGYLGGLAEVIEKAVQKFDTGGYTGIWNNTNGRLAMLHQKELVLNEMDTANMLKAIEIVRSIARVIDLNAGSQAIGLGYLNAASANNHNQVIEQEVTIHAEFPNATDHNEIEMAFDTLINRASQFANRKNI